MIPLRQPHPLASLRACGFADVLSGHRQIPSVHSAILCESRSGDVFFPQMRFDQDILVEASWIMSSQEFEECVKAQMATKLPSSVARIEGCYYAPVGGTPQYTSLAHAASLLLSFANAQEDIGDVHRAQGRMADALAAYALAAATSQSPRHYAKMLLCPMPEWRRQSTQQAIDMQMEKP